MIRITISQIVSCCFVVVVSKESLALPVDLFSRARRCLCAISRLRDIESIKRVQIQTRLSGVVHTCTIGPQMSD